jgi:hypothetical protein
MKVAVLIPDRGDRPKFLENCLRMMKEQTLQPDIIEVVNDPPLSDACDITWRYRIGYDRLRNRGIDVIALIENDDWYHPNYLEAICHNWKMTFRPDILGTNQTIYYHLEKRGYYTMYHDDRSSAMNTLIKPDLNFEWCEDSEPYTDMHLWSVLKGRIVSVVDVTSIGIKHGVGLCGGNMHTTRLKRFERGTQDPHYNFLKKTMDEPSFNFYSNYFK